MIARLLENVIRDKLSMRKVILLYGARQVGKSSLLQTLFGQQTDVLWLNGDESETQLLFENLTVAKVKTLLGKKRNLVIDEAQNILNIGQKLKLIHDNMADVKVVATGSSSFDLANKINEPLTGRKLEYWLYSLSFAEMVNHHGYLDESKMLTHRLVYGSYPEIVCDMEHERELLGNLASSYLYKDILMWENLKKSERILKLLQAIAFQIGSQVSYTELGRMCGLDNKTVEKYIALLEQAFILFRLPSFSRNLRSELKFSRKIYFYDNGIRNALISNFNDVDLRNDVGALWENYLISERVKKLQYEGSYAKSYFWRTKEQTEIDYVEEQDGQLMAFEFKWNEKKSNQQMPDSFARAYPNVAYKVITPQNVEDFLL